MDHSVDPNQVSNTIGNLVQGFSKVFAGGTTSIIILGVVSLIVAGLFWYFRSVIKGLLQKLAAYITAAAKEAQVEQTKKENTEQESQIIVAQNQLANFEASEQKSMLDALSYSDLIKYATSAYGAGAVTGVLQQAASQDAARVGLYLLYGLKQKGT